MSESNFNPVVGAPFSLAAGDPTTNPGWMPPIKDDSEAQTQLSKIPNKPIEKESAQILDKMEQPEHFHARNQRDRDPQLQPAVKKRRKIRIGRKIYIGLLAVFTLGTAGVVGYLGDFSKFVGSEETNYEELFEKFLGEINSFVDSAYEEAKLAADSVMIALGFSAEDELLISKIDKKNKEMGKKTPKQNQSANKVDNIAKITVKAGDGNIEQIKENSLPEVPHLRGVDDPIKSEVTDKSLSDQELATAMASPIATEQKNLPLSPNIANNDKSILKINSYSNLTNALNLAPAMERVWSAQEEEQWRDGIGHVFPWQRLQTVLEVRDNRLDQSKVILWDAQQDKKFWVRIQALFALADFGVPISGQNIVQAIGNENKWTVRNFFKRYYRGASASDCFVLRQSLAVVEPGLRQIVLKALAHYPSDVNDSFLWAGTKDDDLAVRKVALWLTKKWNPEKITKIQGISSANKESGRPSP